MIRRASDADLEALKGLRRGFFDSQIAAGLLDLPADLPAMIEASTANVIAGRRNDVHVAEDETGLVGYLYATTRIVPGYAKPAVGAIEEVFVTRRARGGETARALVETTIAALDARGADRIQLRVLAGNEVGRAFWRKTGFVENVQILELERKDGS